MTAHRTDQAGALFGEVAAVHVSAGFVVLHGHPGPAVGLLGLLEAVDLTDVSDETGLMLGMVRTTAQPGSHGQAGSHRSGEPVDLDVD